MSGKLQFFASIAPYSMPRSTPQARVLPAVFRDNPPNMPSQVWGDAVTRGPQKMTYRAQSRGSFRVICQAPAPAQISREQFLIRALG